MLADAATRGDSFPAWKKDPLGETLRTIEGITKDKVFVDGFANFQRYLGHLRGSLLAK